MLGTLPVHRYVHEVHLKYLNTEVGVPLLQKVGLEMMYKWVQSTFGHTAHFFQLFSPK